VGNETAGYQCKKNYKLMLPQVQNLKQTPASIGIMDEEECKRSAHHMPI